MHIWYSFPSLVSRGELCHLTYPYTDHIHRFCLPRLAGCRVSPYTWLLVTVHRGHTQRGGVLISAPRSLCACALLSSATNSFGVVEAIWTQWISKHIWATVLCLFFWIHKFSMLCFTFRIKSGFQVKLWMHWFDFTNKRLVKSIFSLFF